MAMSNQSFKPLTYVPSTVHQHLGPHYALCMLTNEPLACILQLCICCPLQILVRELFEDGDKCYKIDSQDVMFVDNGMDSNKTCSDDGGCSYTYKYVEGLKASDRGIIYGPFEPGRPNLAAVSNMLYRAGITVHQAAMFSVRPRDMACRTCTFAVCYLLATVHSVHAAPSLHTTHACKHSIHFGGCL